MAEYTVQTPALYKDEQATDPDASLDEKQVGGKDSEKDGVKRDTRVTTDVGDVYEDVRTIDLGKNGKEKPIGVYCCSPFKRYDNNATKRTNMMSLCD